MYGAPSVDGVTVKATLDGRGGPIPGADAVPRELTPAEIAETTETVTEFFPGLIPNIVRSDAFPDLFTPDRNPLLGHLRENSRIYCATGFSGAGFKMATGFGEIAAKETLGTHSFEGLDFVRPQRFTPLNAGDRLSTAAGAQSPVSVGFPAARSDYPGA